MWFDTQKVTNLKNEIALRLDVGDISRPPCAGTASNPVVPVCSFWKPTAISGLVNGTAVIRTVICCHNPAGQQTDFSCHTP